MKRVVQIGAIAIVLAVTTLNAFDLDRFFVPKELVLHLTAFVAGILAIGALRRLPMTRADLLLLAYLGISVLSALLAQNRWLAMRAVAISASGVLLFWIGRAVGRPLLNALALTVVIAAVTSLLQTYGAATRFFSINRAPGGTLGNRNFIAHVAAFGFPLLLLAAMHARRLLPGAIGTAIVAASLVLTRSRAAWLAFAAVLFVFLAAMLVRREARAWRRLAAILAVACAGVAAALLLPNALHWRSENPYLESMRRVADYQSGSGHGRLVQYERSLLLAARHPLLGVGPGNWAVDYPAHAPNGDPSLNDSEPGTTFNPWPSSDWIAIAAERGPLAVIVLLLAFAAIALDGFRQLRTSDEPLFAAALLSMVAGVFVAGLFDAVLLLAVPTFLVWSALGALCHPESNEGPGGLGGTPSVATTSRHPTAREIAILLILASAAGAAHSAAQLDAMVIYSTHGDRASLLRAARIDPGNYRLQLRLGRAGGRGRCEHARAARELFPAAQAAVDAARGCGK